MDHTGAVVYHSYVSVHPHNVIDYRTDCKLTVLNSVTELTTSERYPCD